MTSNSGRTWQASRTFSGAPMRASVARSITEAEGSSGSPLWIRTRQVEQRARPPQTEFMRECGSNDWPRGSSSRAAPSPWARSRRRSSRLAFAARASCGAPGRTTRATRAM